MECYVFNRKDIYLYPLTERNVHDMLFKKHIVKQHIQYDPVFVKLKSFYLLVNNKNISETIIGQQVPGSFNFFYFSTFCNGNVLIHEEFQQGLKNETHLLFTTEGGYQQKNNLNTFSTGRFHESDDDVYLCANVFQALLITRRWPDGTGSFHHRHHYESYA